MIRLIEKLASRDVPAQASVTLRWDQRARSRLRARLDDGREAGVFLSRGQCLQHGDRLRSDSGLIVLVRAASEQVSTVRCDDPLLLARAAYHLGNRHVAVQIGPRLLRYLHDPVLDEMLGRLGVAAQIEEISFEPEPGAYRDTHGHAHRHGH